MSRAKIGNRVENGTMNSDATVTINRLPGTSSLRHETVIRSHYCARRTRSRRHGSFARAAARRPDHILCGPEGRQKKKTILGHRTPRRLKTEISTPAKARPVLRAMLKTTAFRPMALVWVSAGTCRRSWRRGPAEEAPARRPSEAQSHRHARTE
jgi:hypothetical protein